MFTEFLRKFYGTFTEIVLTLKRRLWKRKVDEDFAFVLVDRIDRTGRSNRTAAAMTKRRFDDKTTPN